MASSEMPFAQTTDNPSQPAPPPSAVEAEPRRFTRTEWGWTLLAAVVAAIIRILNSDRRGFWLDEYYTLRAAAMRLPDLVTDRLHAGHSPLPFLYAKIPLLLGGHEEWVLRLTSSLTVGVAVVGIAGLALSLGLRRHLPALLAFAAAQPYWIRIGTEYRYMMPLVALGTLTAWAAVEYSRSWRWTAGIALAAGTAAMLWTHGSAPMLLVPLSLFVAWESWTAGDGKGTWAILRDQWPLGLGLAAGVPIFCLLRGELEHGHRGLPHLDAIVRDLCRVTFANFHPFPAGLGLPNGAWWLPLVAGIVAAYILSRRELRSRGNVRAWRLLVIGGIGVPATLLVLASTLLAIGGPARYLALFSIPTTLALAVSWNAVVTPGRRRFWRGALIAAVGVQMVVALTDPGDRSRDAALWIKDHETGGEPVLVSTNMCLYAFNYLGFPNSDLLNSLGGDERDPKKVRAAVMDTLGDSPRGFVYLYHTDAPVPKALQSLHRAGMIEGYRMWGGPYTAIVVAMVRTPEDLSWLRSLPAPPGLPEMTAAPPAEASATSQEAARVSAVGP